MAVRIYPFFIAFLVCFPVAGQANTDLPVNGVVTSGVGWRLDPFGSGKHAFHRGIDIAVPVGTPVHATRSGKVVFAGQRRGYGATVIVEHSNGDRTLYGHNSALNVTAGASVASGAVIAYSGNSGRSTGPHVHYEQIPGGHPAAEATAVAAAEPRTATGPGTATDNADARRTLLEQQMDESLNSLLKTITSEITGG